MFLATYGWMIAAGFFFLLIVLFLFSPIRLDGYLSKQGVNDEICFKAKALFGLARYRIRIPIVIFGGSSLSIKEQSRQDMPWKHASGSIDEEIDKDKVMSAIDKMQTVLRLFRHFQLWIRRSLKRVRVTEWAWHTTVGAGDAMWTAMATGTVWSVKTSLTGLISQFVRLQAEPAISVQPVYNGESVFHTEWSCTAKLTLWDAIVIGMQLAARLKKTKTSIKQLQRLMKPSSPAPS